MEKNEFAEGVGRLAGEASPRCVEFLHDLVTLPSPTGLRARDA